MTWPGPTWPSVWSFKHDTKIREINEADIARVAIVVCLSLVDGITQNAARARRSLNLLYQLVQPAHSWPLAAFAAFAALLARHGAPLHVPSICFRSSATVVRLRAKV